MELCEGYSLVRVQSLVLFFFFTRLCNMTTNLVTYIFFAPNILIKNFMCAISALRSLSLVWDTRVLSPYPPLPQKTQQPKPQ